MNDVPTLSGNEITDITRRTNTQGDGLLPEQGSTGIWEATTNLVTNGGLESNTTGWNSGASFGTNAGATISRVASQRKFGGFSLEVITPGVASSEGCFFDFFSVTSG